MPRKENTKAITWERDRRKRMNSYFKTLADLLPPQQEGRKRNKVDILIHASKYIKDLHSRTEELFVTHASEAHKEELARLKKLVTLLFSRTQLLSTLLKEAGITIPAEPALEKLSALKWSNKINADDIEKYYDGGTEKTNFEKKSEKSAEPQVPSKKKSIGSSRSSSKKISKNGGVSKKQSSCIENQENRVNSANNKSDITDANNGSTSEAGSRDVDRREPTSDSISDVPTACTVNRKKSKLLQKVGTEKSIARKKRRQGGKKLSAPCIKNPVASLTPNTLILSGGKLMPLVTPMTSNIIVNAQQQSASPIILSSAQQNQMFVMQPLTNRMQNPVVSICNQALIASNTMQKVTLNTVPSIRAKMVVDSQNWASNVKNIINATKIGGHKGILPKGKEVTKTTMTYKVPIPAVHKEKVDRSKECKRDSEPLKPFNKNKNNAKSNKRQQSPETTEGKTERHQTSKEPETINSGMEKGILKRRLSGDLGSTEKTEDKKRKVCETTDSGTGTTEEPISGTLESDSFMDTSNENLQCIIDKIENHLENQQRDEAASVSKDSSATSNLPNDASVPASTVSSEPKDASIERPDTSSQGAPSEEKTDQSAPISEVVPVVSFSEETLKSSSPTVPVPPVVSEFVVPVKTVVEKDTSNIVEVNSSPKVAIPTVHEQVVSGAGVNSKKSKEVCSLGTQLDNLLQVPKEIEGVEVSSNSENNKIILNLDTNTTTTLKPESTAIVEKSEPSRSTSSLLPSDVIDDPKLSKSSKQEEHATKTLSYNTENTFVPIGHRAEGLHSDLSNDIFASLQVPSSSHNPESISPTAAFLMAFPLVSSLNGKTEVLDEEMKDDFKYHSQTPPMLLQIGAMEPNSFKVKPTSPSQAIAEKQLKVPCEEKKREPAASETENTGLIVATECAPVGKVLPKVVNEETLREPYKIVQAVLTPAIEKPATSVNSFTHAPLYSSAPPVAITTMANRNQLSDTLENGIRNAVSENSIRPEAGIIVASSPVEKPESVACPVQESICETTVRYSASQDFLPNYSVVSDNSSKSLQQTTTIFTNPIVTSHSERSTALSQHIVSNATHVSRASNLTNTISTANSSSLTLPQFPMVYSSQMKNKNDSQHGSQEIESYRMQEKASLTENTLTPSSRVTYTDHIGRVLSASTQTTRESYSVQPKDISLPASLSSRAPHRGYDAPSKNDHQLPLIPEHTSQQTFSSQEKNSIVRNGDYNVIQNKSSSQKDSMSYVSSSNTNPSTQNQSYSSKEPIPSSSEPHFQRDYQKLSKETNISSSVIGDHDSKLNNTLRSEVQDQQDHRRDTSYGSTKKIDIDPFSQSFSYSVKESISTQSDQGMVNSSTDSIRMYQEKREDGQQYASFPNKDLKKTAVSSPNSSPKTLGQNISVPRYPQQATSFVATSNYEQSTVTDNHAKSTTTVAHNSSNFSILSWTTFSPVSGSNNNNNNNLVHFEQGPNQSDNTEGKTICENYNYIPLHKENPSFSSILTNDTYTTNISVASMDKARMKPAIESQKSTFLDPSKQANVQGSVPVVSKQNRMANQNQTTSSNTDYKYNSDAKSKTKYNLDTDYIQNEYSGIEQQSQPQQQQHGPKNHQSMSAAKQDKTGYSMPVYDPQVSFDLPEVSTHAKYSVDTYASSNFKYTEKPQQQSQNKYQTLIQSQVPGLQHDSAVYNNDGKQNQLQNTTKSKGNQSQYALRAPVNWMMTPEIKHNANIADIILPPIGKELEFCQNNLFAQTPSYNQGATNQFYNNYDVAAHSFSNLPVLQSEPKRSTDAFYTEEQQFPWSPTKTGVHIEQGQVVKSIEQHIAPSTLPTLVGDLDLGTTASEKQNFLFGQVSSRVSTEHNKDPAKNKESNVTNRDYHHAVFNAQSAQHTGLGSSSFLSVSQLVEHEKAEKSHQQHYQQHHNHHHHHHHHPPHQQPQQQQHQHQTRKHQRKTNTSPRGNSKRQIDIRKQTASNEQLHQRHDEQKSSAHAFSEQAYQQQKYQQNSMHWRSRNCKSNYTAEALIGSNNNIHESGQEKHASIKFTPNYSQNKFQANLSTTDTVMPINYFSNADDGSGYGQMVNQNFNSYAYTSNANIYPSSNFITSIPNTPTGYMMPLHESTDYMEANAFLLPNVPVSSGTVSSSTTSVTTTSTTNVSAGGNIKSQQQYPKNQNCDKRNYSTNVKKGKRKGLDGTIQNLDFPLSGINSPLEDYHHSTFLPPPPPPPPPHAGPLYQNHTQTNVYSKTVNGLPPPPVAAASQGVPTAVTASFTMNPNMPRGSAVSSNPMTMTHHPSGTSLTNFNLSTIFPEMNDKITGYKPPNSIPVGLSQPPNQSTSYGQRSNYPTNPLCHLPQVSEGGQFGNTVPPPPPPGVLHYKNV